jgi:hypothetical protein
MSEPKESESFFRKMVRFVANPATDWTDLNSRQDSGTGDLEKSELKAMIERKRRNDFVRKREFDMLRKVRREGLTAEQLASLGGSSRLDDSEAKLSDLVVRGDVGVKAKIDEIEQQMVGDGATPGRRGPGSFGSQTRSSSLSGEQTMPAAFNARPQPPTEVPQEAEPPPAAAAAPAFAEQVPVPRPLPGLPPIPAPDAPAVDADFGGVFDAVEVSEVVHDPELDEAVISFANADFAQCEQALAVLTGSDGGRADHADTWLVRFDLYRATGQQPPFESLATEYAERFGRSAPQWYSLPRQVAEATAAQERLPLRSTRVAGDVGWVCPAVLDTDAVARLRSQTLQMPLPWVFDWGALVRVEAEAATQMSELFRQWFEQPLDMRWLSGDTFFNVLQEAAPTGMRDADPAFWVARLEGLRLVNQPDQFDEAAIDYCVTYEVSPPSWERSRCQVRISGSGHSTASTPLSQVSEVSTSFVESGLTDDAGSGAFEVASVELSGQLVGDISATLTNLDRQLGSATLVSVTCSKLIRVDFIAAGDLLNWVLAKRAENRTVSFIDAHRLVALFLGAMGINEHARVRVGVV